jgi:uncharacterized Zn finger protein
MEVITKPSSAKYRIIIRDEASDKSKSFGLYSTNLEIDQVWKMIKNHVEKINEYEEEEEEV